MRAPITFPSALLSKHTYSPAFPPKSSFKRPEGGLLTVFSSRRIYNWFPCFLLLYLTRSYSHSSIGPYFWPSVHACQSISLWGTLPPRVGQKRKPNPWTNLFPYFTWVYYAYEYYFYYYQLSIIYTRIFSPFQIPRKPQTPFIRSVHAL